MRRARVTGDPVGRTRALASVLLALWLVIVLEADRAGAYWSASTVAGGSATANLGAVLKGNIPSLSASGRNITVSWAESLTADGSGVTGYTVQRYSTTNVLQTTLAGCSGTVAAASCTELNVPDGLWTYAVTPMYRLWAGPASDRSVQVRSDGSAPSLTITRTATSGNSVLTGSTLFYRGVAPGSFTLTVAVSDAGSGSASATTTALTPAGLEWLHVPSTVTTPAGGPYVTNPFTWVTGASSTVSEIVSGTDTSGNSAARTLSFVNDSTPPTGGTVSHPTGVRASRSVTITTTAVTDAGAGVASRILQRRGATLTVATNTCGTFGAWATTSTSPASSLTQNLTNNNCYQYQYVLTDNVGNTTTVPGPGTVKIRAYSTVIRGTSGILDYYRLGATTGSTFADNVTGSTTNTGTWSGDPALNVAGAILGDTDGAVGFDGTDDSGVINRGSTGNANFSIEFWFRSTGGLGTGSNWTDGAGLVDASAAGTVGDFGTALMQDGRICAGTGNPDVSACTPLGYADGQWHHVVFTRTASTRTLVLYVDGVARATGLLTSNAALNASATIRIGALNSGTNFFTGALDEVALYTTAISAATVSSHYQANQP